MVFFRIKNQQLRCYRELWNELFADFSRFPHTIQDPASFSVSELILWKVGGRIGLAFKASSSFSIMSVLRFWPTFFVLGGQPSGLHSQPFSIGPPLTNSPGETGIFNQRRNSVRGKKKRKEKYQSNAKKRKPFEPGMYSVNQIRDAEGIRDTLVARVL